MEWILTWRASHDNVLSSIPGKVSRDEVPSTFSGAIGTPSQLHMVSSSEHLHTGYYILGMGWGGGGGQY